VVIGVQGEVDGCYELTKITYKLNVWKLRNKNKFLKLLRIFKCKILSQPIFIA
jgi:hypothetical protein